jgi:hypothetical protein
MNNKPGWYYCYNEKRKQPINKAVMKVCKFIKDNGNRCDVWIIGAGLITVDYDQLEIMHLKREWDIEAFCKAFPVQAAQKAQWEGLSN